MKFSKEIQILLCQSSIVSDDNGRVTGILFFVDGEFIFPGKDWNDFVVLLLTWWAESIYRILLESSQEESLEFMDGPYSMLCSMQEDIINYEFIEDREESRTLWSGNTNINHLANEVIRSGDKVLETCIEKGISTNDIDYLNQALTTLRNLM